MNRWKIGITMAALSGVASFRILPVDWVLPALGIGIAVALVSAVGARVDTKPRKPVDPTIDLALSLINLPPDPLAKVPDGWPLLAFAVAATYVFSLGLSIMWGAAHA